jgi:D-alanyl-D-alanine carboxypeptidase
MSRQWVSTVLAAAVLRRATIASVKVVPAIVLLASLSGAALFGVATATAAPESAAGSGLRPIDQNSLQRLLAKTARELHVPGAVVLLRTPQGELTAAYGTTQLGSRIRPRAYTHFRIASITKTMTSAVILQLAQEGKLRLGDRISKYVSGVPNGNNITLAELLEMRSGLYDYTSAPEMAGFFDHHPTKVWTPREVLAISFARPPNFPPGTDYEYSNTNYALLGLVIEKVDCRSLAAAMRERLFRPLDMKYTFLPPRTSNRIPEPYAHGYLYGSSSIITTGIPNPPYTPAFLAAVNAGKIQPKDYTDVNHSFASAAGGVISTADDLGTWFRALVGGRVFNAKYQRIWRNSLKPADNRLDYGFGINRLSWKHNNFYLHGGETVGFNSEAGYDPVNKLTLVLWTNLTVSPTEKLTANVLMLRVLDRIYKQSPLDP